MQSGIFHVIKDGIIYELKPEEGGGYVVTVPALPGCMTVGDTIDAALVMVQEAMELWLDVAREKGLYIPAQFEQVKQAFLSCPTSSPPFSGIA
ncbi:MAG: type II toxin-antitoxin system HicB family antitoxin [Dehalococcoidia bacterium]